MICLNETLYKIYVKRKSVDKFLKKKILAASDILDVFTQAIEV